jgi:hypothetical protein
VTREELIYGKDIPVTKATADPTSDSDPSEVVLPDDLQALLDDESVVLPGEDRAWRKVLEWVRGRS